MLKTLFRPKSVIAAQNMAANEIPVPKFNPSIDYGRQITDKHVLLMLAAIAVRTSPRPGNIPWGTVVNCICWNWLNLDEAIRNLKQRYGMNEVPANGNLDPSFANDNTIICLTENGSLIALLPSGPDLYYESIPLCPGFRSKEHSKLKPSCCFESVRFYSAIRPGAPFSTSAMLTSELMRIYWKAGLDRPLVDRMKETASYLRVRAEESVKAILPDAA